MVGSGVEVREVVERFVVVGECCSGVGWWKEGGGFGWSRGVVVFGASRGIELEQCLRRH